MRCQVCGGSMETRVTDLPFKTGDRSIVILKALPVLQCRQCADIELEHEVMERVEAVLASANRVAELEIVPYAA